MHEEKTARTLDVRVGDTYFAIGGPLSLLKWLFRSLLARWRRKPEPPGYPYADKLAPIRRGPRGRSGAAVADLDDEPPRR
jgi:hypothetical protein